MPKLWRIRNFSLGFSLKYRDCTRCTQQDCSYYHLNSFWFLCHLSIFIDQRCPSSEVNLVAQLCLDLKQIPYSKFCCLCQIMMRRVCIFNYWRQHPNQEARNIQGCKKCLWPWIGRSNSPCRSPSQRNHLLD